MSRRRPPLLIALQTEATVLMSVAIGQAGLAAAFLSGQGQFKAVHAVVGIVIAVLTVALLVTAVAYRREGGPRWPVLATGLVLVWAAVQIVFGKLELAGIHIFSGVLFVVLATVLTSYLFWFAQPPAQQHRS